MAAQKSDNFWMMISLVDARYLPGPAMSRNYVSSISRANERWRNKINIV
jgi:hypothetical protein